MREKDRIYHRRRQLNAILDEDKLDTSGARKIRTWEVIARVLTFMIPSRCLDFGMDRDSEAGIEKEIAWREKVALCIVIFLSCIALGFLTFGMTVVVCRPPIDNVINYKELSKHDPNSPGPNWISVGGVVYAISKNAHLMTPEGDLYHYYAGRDATAAFPQTASCDKIGVNVKYTCVAPNGKSIDCLDRIILSPPNISQIGHLYYKWGDLDSISGHFTYNGTVLDLTKYLLHHKTTPGILGKDIEKRLNSAPKNHDITRLLSSLSKDKLQCLEDAFKVGRIDVKSVGCIFTDVILYTSLVVILAVVFAKFILATFFISFMSRKLRAHESKTDENQRKKEMDHLQINEITRTSNNKRRDSLSSFSSLKTSLSMSTIPSFSDTATLQLVDNASIQFNPDNPVDKPMVFTSFDTPDEYLYTIMAVTCYCEDESGLRVTLDSLAATNYPNDKKLILVIADGIITGSGNVKSTPEIIIDMINIDRSAGSINGYPWSYWLKLDEEGDDPLTPSASLPVQNYEKYASDTDDHWKPHPYSYVAITDGEKRHNMARVYAGYYKHDPNRIPMVLIVKCGTPSEAHLTKPGNRGKRDSQIILMLFLSKLLFNDRLTPLEYDLALKIQHITGVPPSFYELLLFVDADTKVMPSAVKHMVSVFMMDPLVMGLCGETQISNKFQSWVTAIQVFEYFISHYLNKSFESIFGGVTCLPGCFCMYRIKVKCNTVDRGWIPILTSPSIIDHYSENVTITLHKKNLLLLGEDRYLTTLMLKAFPNRKMVFVPIAKCKTVVPNTFSVLLSQRRRWINSTIHNLFELVLVDDLCGAFCCSMQFVVMMELIGTLVLPAAIVFTGVLITSSFIGEPQYIPLFLLAMILGLPALLIFFTAQSLTYVFYMLCYFLSLPIWNFVLPVYAFWHFDDFTWGETRRVVGDTGSHGEKEGEFDYTKIYMRKGNDYANALEKALFNSKLPDSPSTII